LLPVIHPQMMQYLVPTYYQKMLNERGISIKSATRMFLNICSSLINRK
jgi:hypothetical protein